MIAAIRPDIETGLYFSNLWIYCWFSTQVLHEERRKGRRGKQKIRNTSFRFYFHLINDTVCQRGIEVEQKVPYYFSFFNKLELRNIFGKKKVKKIQHACDFSVNRILIAFSPLKERFSNLTTKRKSNQKLLNSLISLMNF